MEEKKTISGWVGGWVVGGAYQVPLFESTREEAHAHIEEDEVFSHYP